MGQATLGNLFKKIIIRSSLKKVQSVFISNRNLDYKPAYQRNYIWTKVKATYFIETLLLQGEVPPIIIYLKGDATYEVIDGRQRCETIDKFLNDEFSLQPGGLEQLRYLSGKKFSDLTEGQQARIRQTILRCTIVEAQSENELTTHEEDQIKRELFRRHNVGISPLKKEEVYKAQYLHDPITVYYKEQFKLDTALYNMIRNIFDYKSKNIETLMQHIRQSLILVNIPINKYILDGEDITNPYYDLFSYQESNKGEKNIEFIFTEFRKKIEFLESIKKMLSFSNAPTNSNLIVYDCIYWAITVCEKENIAFRDINNGIFKNRLVKHISKNIVNYAIEYSNYRQYISDRYELMATFFSSQFPLDFTSYLKSDKVRSETLHRQISQYMMERFGIEPENDMFTKALPTSSTIIDILSEMANRKFNITPSYQRNEVTNIAKASSLIESILLGIKLAPVYTFTREDGVSEVIDGQQRLLTFIGFLGEKYSDENGQMRRSKKNNFQLNLTESLLPNIHKKKFHHLPEDYKNRILNYDLHIVEIKQSENPDFKPEDLFKRLNYKPFPIKEHTFEYWNAYIDRDIINAIKDICKRHSWLYIYKNNARMKNEGLVSCLCYLNFMLSDAQSMDINAIKEVLDFYEYSSHTVARLKKKEHVSQILESADCKADLFLSLIDLEENFIEKVICLTNNPKGKTTESFRNTRLDKILQTSNNRMPMRFYVLWLILKGISIEYIESSQSRVLNSISKLFSTLKVPESKGKFEKLIAETWKEFENTLVAEQ